MRKKLYQQAIDIFKRWHLKNNYRVHTCNLFAANFYHNAKPLNTQFSNNFLIFLTLQKLNSDKNISKTSIKCEHVPITIS